MQFQVIQGVSIQCIAFSLNKKLTINPTITQAYHHCPYMLTMARVLGDILFISVAKGKLN